MTSQRRCVHSVLLVGNAAVFGHSFEIAVRSGSQNAFSSKAGCRADRFVWFSWVIAPMRSVKICFYGVKKTDTFCLVSAPWALCWKAGDDFLMAKNRCKKTSESQGPTEVCVKKRQGCLNVRADEQSRRGPGDRNRGEGRCRARERGWGPCRKGRRWRRSG